MISKVNIENIKGYGIPGRTINLNLSVSKINLCIAPNGFGKSSLAIAFESLKRNRLNVSQDNKHYENQDAPSKIVLTMDDIDYVADENKNELSPVIRVCVINNRTCVDYTKEAFARIINVKAFSKIEELIICNIPPKTVPKYTIRNIRNEFGYNGKILFPINGLLNNSNFLVDIRKINNVLNKFNAKT